jgi:hypothetical protein
MKNDRWRAISRFADPLNCRVALTLGNIPGLNSKKGPTFGPLSLLLLLALVMSLLAGLSSILGVLLGVRRMFFALRMVPFAMLFCSSAVGLGSILVMFGCFVVLVSSHWIPPVNVEVN